MKKLIITIFFLLSTLVYGQYAPLDFGDFNNDRYINYGTLGNYELSADSGSVISLVYPDNIGGAQVQNIASKRASANGGWNINASQWTGGRIRGHIDNTPYDANQELTVSSENLLSDDVWQTVAFSWELSAAADTFDQIIYKSTGPKSVLVDDSDDTGSTSRRMMQPGQSPTLCATEDFWIGRMRAETTWGEYSGDIAFVAVYKIDYPLTRLQKYQFFPRVDENCLFYSWLGHAGTGTQRNWAGTGDGTLNNGITQSTIPYPVHIPGRYVLAGRRR